MAAAGGHWTKGGGFKPFPARQARAAGLAYDVGKRIRDVEGRTAQVRNQWGPLTRADSRRQAKDLKNLDRQADILRSRRIALNNVAAGIE